MKYYRKLLTFWSVPRRAPLISPSRRLPPKFAVDVLLYIFKAQVLDENLKFSSCLDHWLRAASELQKFFLEEVRQLSLWNLFLKVKKVYQPSTKGYL